MPIRTKIEMSKYNIHVPIGCTHRAVNATHGTNEVVMSHTFLVHSTPVGVYHWYRNTTRVTLPAYKARVDARRPTTHPTCSRATHVSFHRKAVGFNKTQRLSLIARTDNF
jgi:hypothetical protein